MSSTSEIVFSTLRFYVFDQLIDFFKLCGGTSQTAFSALGPILFFLTVAIRQWRYIRLAINSLCLSIHVFVISLPGTAIVTVFLWGLPVVVLERIQLEAGLSSAVVTSALQVVVASTLMHWELRLSYDQNTQKSTNLPIPTVAMKATRTVASQTQNVVPIYIEEVKTTRTLATQTTDDLTTSSQSPTPPPIPPLTTPRRRVRSLREMW